MKRVLLLLCLFASFAAFAQPQQQLNAMRGRHGMDTIARVASPFSKISTTASVIVLNIPDIVVGETTVKRTATYSKMEDNRDAKSLSLIWTIKYYATDSLGNYAAYLGGTFPDKKKVFTATNSIMVNPANGKVLTPDINGNYAMNYVGQYDFFNSVADNVSIKFSDMIRQFGTTANWN